MTKGEASWGLADAATLTAVVTGPVVLACLCPPAVPALAASEGTALSVLAAIGSGGPGLALASDPTTPSPTAWIARMFRKLKNGRRFRQVTRKEEVR